MSRCMPIAALVALGFQAPAVERAASAREVSFESSGASIAATLHLPGSKERVPAVVVVHGSGPSDRSNPWTQAYANAFVARGIAVLHPDKRGSGKSTGDWRTASFETLAEDAERGLAFLREQSEVDRERVGLIGFSQGVDVAPLCAAKSGRADFVICVSGSVVPLLEQVLDEIELDLDAKGTRWSQDERGAVERVHRLALDFARTREGWESFQSELKHASDSGGAVAAGLAGVPRDKEHWVWGWLAQVGSFDPLLAWREVRAPMLFVYGGRDRQVKGTKSLERLRAAFAGSDQNWCSLELAPNGHALFREDVCDFAARWIRDKGAP